MIFFNFKKISLKQFVILIIDVIFFIIKDNFIKKTKKIIKPPDISSYLKKYNKLK